MRLYWWKMKGTRMVATRTTEDHSQSITASQTSRIVSRILEYEWIILAGRLLAAAPRR